MPVMISLLKGIHMAKPISIYRILIAGCHDTHARSGFALIGVVMLSAIIGIMMPMLLNLESENRNMMRQHQSRAVALAMAHHVFGLSYDQYLTHAGLPIGWVRGDNLSSQQANAVSSCSHALSHNDQWQRQDARVSTIMIEPVTHPHHGDQLIMAIARHHIASNIGRSDTPHLVHIVMGCVITDRPFSQLAVVRGNYWQIGDRIIAGEWQAGTS
jgi:hypothetical protein